MYSGTTFRRASGRIVGVHQKIDRVARRSLDQHIPKSLNFPGIRSILHFEGRNGPDGIKLKSPAKDELFHFINPIDPTDRQLLVIIHGHLVNLSEAIKTKNDVRAAFEAAWLAHAVVDGLTPPHHYPPTEKVKKSLSKVDSELLSNNRKNILKEMKRNRQLIKKWKKWGTRGVLSHVMFEWGVASVIAPDKFVDAGPNVDDLDYLRQVGFEAIFMQAVARVDSMRMYDEFNQTGWTRALAVKTKDILIPEIIKTVALAWYQAALMTSKVK